MDLRIPEEILQPGFTYKFTLTVEPDLEIQSIPFDKVSEYTSIAEIGVKTLPVPFGGKLEVCYHFFIILNELRLFHVIIRAITVNKPLSGLTVNHQHYIG